jgi:alpha-D-xyloside xylohydrolase
MNPRALVRTEGLMDVANLGLSHALSSERREDGVDFHCVAAGLAAARVSLRAVGRDVIRVRITPGLEEVPKAFSYVAARPVGGRVTVGEADGRVTLATERLTVEAVLDPWQLSFRAADGRLLTQEVRDDVNFGGHRLGPAPGLLVEGGGPDPARRTRAVVETLLLRPEDHFFGGGERFSRLDQVGRTVLIWQRNPYGARSELAYKNIPLLVGTRGYGLFVDVPTAVTFHVGSRSLRTLGVEAAGAELDYYLIAGTPKEILSTYTELTGRPAVPPAWAFGLWASTFFIAFTESSVLEHTRRLRAEGITGRASAPARGSTPMSRC